MKRDDVPQDGDDSTYGGHRKLLYAVDNDGHYQSVGSLGWSVEADATRDALGGIARDCRCAWQRAQAGDSAPLEYHMYACRMDLPLLAQAAGISRWRLRRHLRPAVFRRLSERVMLRYANALGMDVATLCQLPDTPGC